MQIITFPIRLESAYMLSPKVKHFVFHCESQQPFRYLPGQFITVHFENSGKILKRSYSIANACNLDNRIEFAAGFIEGGPGTDLLFNLKPGDRININGPFGRLLLKEEAPKRYILVATSTGVTPYRAMIPEMTRQLKADSRLQVVILLGVQSPEEALYANEFQAFANLFPSQVLFSPCFSRAQAGTLNDAAFCGYVQKQFPNLDLNPEQDLVYLCGNPGMVDESFAYLQTQGFTTKEIIREKYISR